MNIFITSIYDKTCHTTVKNEEFPHCKEDLESSSLPIRLPNPLIFKTAEDMGKKSITWLTPSRRRRYILKKRLYAIIPVQFTKKDNSANYGSIGLDIARKLAGSNQTKQSAPKKNKMSGSMTREEDAPLL